MLRTGPLRMTFPPATSPKRPPPKHAAPRRTPCRTEALDTDTACACTPAAHRIPCCTLAEWQGKGTCEDSCFRTGGGSWAQRCHRPTCSACDECGMLAAAAGKYNDWRHWGGGVESSSAAAPTPGPAGSGPSYAVYRLLGNNMRPLQGAGQIRQNSAYALRYEVPPPPGVSVYWVVNRILNTTERGRLLSELKAADASGDNILHVDPPFTMVGCLSEDRPVDGEQCHIPPYDRPSFRDPLGYGCSEWTGYAPCDTRDQYSAVELAQVRENCPFTCGRQCPSLLDTQVHFAQAQNAARNAVLAHAHAHGHKWVLPLDGNQFLTADFHPTMRSVLRSADRQGQTAVLIPMLRLDREQTAATLNATTTFANFVRGAGARHANGGLLVSEPQLALRTDVEADKGSPRFGLSGYGKRNKATFLSQLCTAHSSTTMCCDLVHGRLRAKEVSKNRTYGAEGVLRHYGGGEFDLKEAVTRSYRDVAGRHAPPLHPEAARYFTTRAASKLHMRCGALIRMYSYAEEAEETHAFSGLVRGVVPDFTNERTRHRLRANAGKIFSSHLRRYLQLALPPQVDACRSLERRGWTNAMLTAVDPDTRGQTPNMESDSK